MKDSVTITKREYMQLLEDSLELGALGDAGVDNWGGIDEAFGDWYEDALIKLEEKVKAM